MNKNKIVVSTNSICPELGNGRSVKFVQLFLQRQRSAVFQFIVFRVHSVSSQSVVFVGVSQDLSVLLNYSFFHCISCMFVTY